MSPPLPRNHSIPPHVTFPKGGRVVPPGPMLQTAGQTKTQAAKMAPAPGCLPPRPTDPAPAGPGSDILRSRQFRRWVREPGGAGDGQGQTITDLWAATRRPPTIGRAAVNLWSQRRICTAITKRGTCTELAHRVDRAGMPECGARTGMSRRNAAKDASERDSCAETSPHGTCVDALKRGSCADMAGRGTDEGAPEREGSADMAGRGTDVRATERGGSADMISRHPQRGRA